MGKGLESALVGLVFGSHLGLSTLAFPVMEGAFSEEEAAGREGCLDFADTPRVPFSLGSAEWAPFTCLAMAWPCSGLPWAPHLPTPSCGKG